MSNILKLEKGTKVEFHPHRTALVFGVFFEIDRGTIAAMDFENELNKAAGKNGIDNHTAYTLTNSDGGQIHVWCSDSAMRFGQFLEKKYW